MELTPIDLGAGLDLLGAIAPGATPEPTQLWKFLARFHSVLLHLPIGFIALVLLLEGVGVLLFRKREEKARLVTFTLVVSTLSGAVVAILGRLLANEGGYDEQTLQWHQWLGFGVVALTLFTTVAHLRAQRRPADWSPYLAYLGSLGALGLLIIVTGHHGGNLTHGSEYLVKYAPPFVKKLVAAAETGAPGAPGGSAASSGDQHFEAVVRPILERKCLGCHGPEKQKGDYRLDLRARALEAGESGVPGLVPGEPVKSRVTQLILLPETADEAMPPRGKDRLTPDEVMTLVHWIQAGAPYGGDPAPSPLQGKEEPGAATAPQSPAEAAPSVLAEASVGLTPASAQEPGAPVPAVEKPEASSASGAPAIDFAREVQPLLVSRCLSCHSAEKHKGKLDLSARDAAIRGGKKAGPGIVPGKPAESSLWKRAAIRPESEDADDLMPPPRDGNPLAPAEVALLERWITEGAPWPEGIHLEPIATTQDASPPAEPAGPSR